MTIKEIVQKAIDGGYVEAPTHTFITANQYWVVWKDGNGSEYTIALQVYLLDPKFWLAMGNVEGWQYADSRHLISYRGVETLVPNGDWAERMHEMIDSVNSGKTIEQFLSTL